MGSRFLRTSAEMAGRALSPRAWPSRLVATNPVMRQTRVRFRPIANVRRRDYNVIMSGKATAFVAGVLLASLFWIVLAQQSYCAGSLADWLHMGDVEECR